MNYRNRGTPVVVVAAVGGATVTDVGVVLHVGALGTGELQARSPALADNVVHLLGDLVVGQRGQVREGLKEPAQSIKAQRQSRLRNTRHISKG